MLAFWVGMAVAAHAYRPGYDWRYQTISVLLYADQNPQGYRWAWAGLELCGLAGFAWTTGLHTRHAIGLCLLQMGFLFMCCAVLPDRLLPWSRGHEVFAILAFLGICIGITSQMSMMGARRQARIWTWGMVLPLAPLLLAGLTQAYLALARPNLPWVTPDWRARGISPFLSFGLWEWASCAVLSLCMLVLWHHRPTGV